MKYQILATQKDNELYFDNKLSKKHNFLIIERIIRNIKTESGITSGIVTRRGNCPLEVIKEDGQWVINGETEKRNTNQNKTNNNKSKSWDNLTNHEQTLLTAVKFDLFDEWDECEKAAKQASEETSLTELFDGIPRLNENQIYFLNNQKYKIIKNNGKTVVFFGQNGEEKRTLEADTFGEFIRLDNGIIHSVDFIEEINNIKDEK